MAVLAPIVVVVLYIQAGLLWVALLSLGLFVLAGAAATAALTVTRATPGCPRTG